MDRQLNLDIVTLAVLIQRIIGSEIIGSDKDNYIIVYDSSLSAFGLTLGVLARLFPGDRKKEPIEQSKICPLCFPGRQLVISVSPQNLNWTSIRQCGALVIVPWGVHFPFNSDCVVRPTLADHKRAVMICALESCLIGRPVRMRVPSV